ncbi:MAG TPA: hypothetical protein VFO19_17630 [Vicinamibacterales bacterium]|nr:hypothetical protein [Vicinamibacterales bacterium]
MAYLRGRLIGLVLACTLVLTGATAGLTWLVAAHRPAAVSAVAASPLDSPLNGNAYDADSWFRLRRAYPTGRVPAADVLDRAMRAVRPLGVRPHLTITGDRWVHIGPGPIVVQNNHPWIGRVTAVAAHPTNAAVIYAGGDNGGIFRTTDSGATWTSLTENIPVPSIQTIAIDPVNPLLIYAATIQRTYPARWLRSTDGGNTWDLSSITTTDGRSLSPALCSINVFKACIPPSSGRVLIDPRGAGSATSSTIYYTGVSHILRSDDSGRTFRPVLALDVDLDFAGANAANLNREAEYIRDLAFDPQNPDRLYVAVAQPRCANAACDRMTSTIRLSVSNDAGAHWTTQTVASLAEYGLANTRYADPGAIYVPRARLAVSPSHPDAVAIAFRDTALGRPRLYRSRDFGATFTESTLPNNSQTWPLALAYAPNDPDTIYLGSNHLYRTTNGGQSWAQMQNTHVDNIAFAFTASGALLAANDGGLFMGSTGTTFTPIHHRLPITEFYSVAAHPTNPLILAGGTQDNGTLIFQGSLGWSLIRGGDGGDVVFEPGSQTVLYAEVEWFFTDGGQNVFAFYRCQSTGCVTRINGIDVSLDGPFIPDMAMDPSNPSTIWLTAGRLFRTDNRADNWTAASPVISTNQRCWVDPQAGRTCANARYFTAVSVAPTSSQTVYAGALNGDVWATDDRGATWRSVAGVDAGPLPVRAVNDVVVDPADARTVYVAYSGFNEMGSGSGHVFRTRNGGETWEDVSGNLPDVPVNTLLIDPDSAAPGSPRVVYAGTDIGVFRAVLDGGATWQPFGTGMPPVIVNRLAYNASTRQLLAATYGRGMWAISPRFTR